MSDSSNAHATLNNVDPLILYSRALHKYTLALWTESRRIAEEKARGQARRHGRPVYQPSTETTVPHKPAVEEKEKLEATSLTPPTSPDTQIPTSS